MCEFTIYNRTHYTAITITQLCKHVTSQFDDWLWQNDDWF